jgi:Domain of unknown function (DUF3854)
MTDHAKDNNQLAENHYSEWVIGSGVDPEITALNVRSLSGDEVYEYLLYALPQTARRNDGRLREGELRRYAHATLSSWRSNGLDPHNNWEPMDWGRIKPDYPRLEWDKETQNYTAKVIKYESPPKTPNRLGYFRVTLYAWELVSKRYNVPMPEKIVVTPDGEALGFWAWVLAHPQEIPLILSEGEKKTACLISRGYAAIALPGIWNARVGKKDFDERLHPDLVPMAQPGRKFIILFDHETKAKTRWSVYQATMRTGKALVAQGCVCEVASLPGTEKGIDDFVVARGEDANALVTTIINDAKSLKDYQRSYHCKKWGLTKYKPDVTVNVKYLSEALSIPNLEEKPSSELYEIEMEESFSPCVKDLSGREKEKEKGENEKTDSSSDTRRNTFRFPKKGLVVLWSDMGTGKTELMRWWRDQNPNVRFLNNGHRVNLLKNLSDRLKTAMYSDLGYIGLAQAQALSITIDSLHKLNTQSLNYGCIFIDEACQYLTHLLHSNTCKEHRAAILEVLEYIVYNTPLVVIADAHMDDLTVNFFRSMRKEEEVPFIIKNEYRNGGRLIYWYENDNSSALVAQIAAALMSGQKIMVVSDSKRFIKKLDKFFSVKCEEAEEDDSTSSLKIWSIHSDNSGSEENVAFIKDITNAVKSLDALFVSPSLGTGVDIAEYHFDAVFGVFHAVSQTATECAQQLHRYRPKVPFHIWVAPRPPFGYKQTNATKIKEQLLQTNSVAAFLLRIDRQTGKRGVEKDYALDAYCQILAQRHQSINNLRSELRSLLLEMGNTIVTMGTDDDIDTKKRLEVAGALLDSDYNRAVAKANNISSSEYRARKSKDYLKPEEVHECEKFRIGDSYGLEVTEELVEKDEGGRLVRAIAGLEAILSEPSGTIVDPQTNREFPAPPKIVADKDYSERDKLPLSMDWGNYSARWLARVNLGLHDILKRLVAGEEITANDSHLARMTEIAIQCAAHIKAILGFTVPSDCQPIWLLATLIEQLGLKLANRKEGPRGEQVKIYSLAKGELNFALDVIAHRERKRAAYDAQTQSAYSIEPKLRSVSTPPTVGIGNPHCEGVDTTDFHPDNGDASGNVKDERSLIKTYAQMLRDSIKHGVEAVKAIFKRWGTDLRWCVVLELEEMAADQLRQLEELVPQFYALLSEEVLPVEEAH